MKNAVFFFFSYLQISFADYRKFIFHWQVNAYDHVRVIAAVHSTPFFIHVKAKNEERSAADAG